jgi:hypothetical protein
MTEQIGSLLEEVRELRVFRAIPELREFKEPQDHWEAHKDRLGLWDQLALRVIPEYKAKPDCRDL